MNRNAMTEPAVRPASHAALVHLQVTFDVQNDDFFRSERWTA